MDPIKTLVHVHTNYSFDANTTPEALAEAAAREGIGCICVTDHDTIEGALHLRDVTDIRVVVGEEISTRQGDLIGLFLNRRIQPGMSARDTALAVKAQGGLVLVPHPFIKVLGCGLQLAIWEIVDLVDAIEVCNGQNILSRPDRLAGRFADRMGLLSFVGSDSHMDASIAPCYQLMREFAGAAEFLDSLRTARLVHGRHPLWYFAAAACRTMRHLAGLPLPAGYGANYQPAPRATGSGVPAAPVVGVA